MTRDDRLCARPRAALLCALARSASDIREALVGAPEGTNVRQVQHEGIDRKRGLRIHWIANAFRAGDARDI
jgi:hypothetical protein